MLFLTSLSFTILFPALWTLALALTTVVPWPHPVTVSVFYGTTYLVMLAALKALREQLVDDSFRNAGSRRQVDAWIQARGCEWLQITGSAVVCAGAAVLFAAGLLTFHLHFLLGAICLGCLDLCRKNRLIELPGHVPAARTVLDLNQEVADENGKRCVFSWIPRTSKSRRVECRTEFVICHEEFRRAREQKGGSIEDHEVSVCCIRGGNSPAVAEMAAYFRFRSNTLNLTSVKEMEDVICFTRGIHLAEGCGSESKGNRIRFPVETLYEQTGSREDHVLLAAAILFKLGHDLALLNLHLRDGSVRLGLGYHAEGLEIGAMSLLVEGKRYFYVETVAERSAQRTDNVNTDPLFEIVCAEAIPV